MNRITRAMVAAVALAAASACQTASDSPAGPSVLSGQASEDAAITGPGGTALKAGTPVAQSPTGNAAVSNLTPTLVVSGGGMTYLTSPVQYRFRVLNSTGTVAIDSGLQNSPSWTVAAPLSPTTTYSWIARPERQGVIGAWSTAAFFTTPVAPGNDYGAWESSCQPLINDRPGLVNCVWSFVRPTNSVEDLEVVKRVAWILRSQGGGLLIKNSGENVVPWLGMNFSASRVCFPDGHIYKIISDAGPGGTNSPGWSDNDFVEVTLYKAAIDPKLR